MATQQWNWSFTPTRATPAKDLPSNTDWKRVIPTTKVFTNYKVQNSKIRQVQEVRGGPRKSREVWEVGEDWSFTPTRKGFAFQYRLEMSM